MRVLIATVGGRGDVTPFTGLGAALRAAGHTLTIATDDAYTGLVTGCGRQFLPLPGSQDMLDDSRWLQGKPGSASPVRMIRLVAERIRRLHSGIVAVARQEAPEVLALTGITALGGYHVAEGLGLHAMGLQLQPMAPTREFPPSLVGVRSPVDLALAWAFAVEDRPAAGVRLPEYRLVGAARRRPQLTPDLPGRPGQAERQLGRRGTPGGPVAQPAQQVPSTTSSRLATGTGAVRRRRRGTGARSSVFMRRTDPWCPRAKPSSASRASPQRDHKLDRERLCSKRNCVARPAAPCVDGLCPCPGGGGHDR